MADKYLKGGALNPAWCDEQDAARETENIMESMGLLNNIFNDIEADMNLDLQLGEGVGVSANISNKQKEEDIFTNANIEDVYEAKFKFIKNHSNTPEDLKLAREIVGLE